MTIQEDHLHCSPQQEGAREWSARWYKQERETSGGGGGGGYWFPSGFYLILTEMSQQRTNSQADVLHSSHASEKEQEWGKGGKLRGNVIGCWKQRK
jgi:hypothetical protein